MPKNKNLDIKVKMPKNKNKEINLIYNDKISKYGEKFRLESNIFKVRNKKEELDYEQRNIKYWDNLEYDEKYLIVLKCLSEKYTKIIKYYWDPLYDSAKMMIIHMLIYNLKILGTDIIIDPTTTDFLLTSEIEDENDLFKMLELHLTKYSNLGETQREEMRKITLKKIYLALLWILKIKK